MNNKESQTFASLLKLGMTFEQGTYLRMIVVNLIKIDKLVNK